MGWNLGGRPDLSENEGDDLIHDSDMADISGVSTEFLSVSP